MSQTERSSERIVGGCEVYQAELRLIVAPAPGNFQPAALLAEQPAPVAVAAGQVVGHVSGTGGRVAVTSPFAGSLDTVLAWPNERLKKHQGVVALREAS